VPTYLIYGDSFLVSERLSLLESKITSDKVLESNYHRISASSLQVADLMTYCNALPFMDPVRLIIVEGLLGLFDTGNAGPRRSRTRTSRRSLGPWEELPEQLSNIPPTTHLILQDGPINKSNPLLAILSPISELHPVESPTRDTLSRWIKDRALSKGSNINPAAIRLLSDLIGNDLWALDSELEKLCLYANSESIEEHHVTDLVSQVKEANIFNAVDSIINKSPGPALTFLKQLQKDGNDSSYIITMIARQVRLIALTRDLLNQGASQNTIGTKLGINSQFVLKKTLDQASRYSDSQVRYCYESLLNSDLSIKRGLMSSDFALELLTHELSAS